MLWLLIKVLKQAPPPPLSRAPREPAPASLDVAWRGRARGRDRPTAHRPPPSRRGSERATFRIFGKLAPSEIRRGRPARAGRCAPWAAPRRVPWASSLHPGRSGNSRARPPCASARPVPQAASCGPRWRSIPGLPGRPPPPFPALDRAGRIARPRHSRPLGRHRPDRRVRGRLAAFRLQNASGDQSSASRAASPTSGRESGAAACRGSKRPAAAPSSPHRSSKPSASPTILFLTFIMHNRV